MIRFLAMDLDGTLVPHTLKISEENKDAVKKAQEAGVLVTVATGRMSPSAWPYIEQLQINVPVITYNGAVITDPQTGKKLKEAPVDKRLTRSLLELCREKQWYIQAYFEDRLLVYEKNKKSEMYSYISGVPAISIGDDLWSLDSATKLLSIADDDDQRNEMGETFRKYFSKQGNIAESLGNYVEITSMDAEKGKAVAFLCDHYGISIKNAMTIGDGGNDLGMIQVAGLGIAMGGASEKLKNLADHVTGFSEEHGVAQAIQQHILKR